MHIDLNSCFATIEQQANPKWRGKPIAVAAYVSPSGCIIAPSVEAKRCGIRVGMRVKDGKILCPELIVVAPDPWKYRNIHLSLKKLLSDYTEDVVPKSIDEFIINLEGYPSYKKGMEAVGGEIKNRIKKEIGEWLTVSIGIGPNRFLAKTAAGLHKPDGLDRIDAGNYEKVFRSLSLSDLCGIKTANTIRLQGVGIHTVMDFYHAPLWKLKAALQSVNGYYWSLRLHGWEIDDVEFGRHSYGNSYALQKQVSRPEELSPILQKLVEKMGHRMRMAGYKSKGVHISLFYRDMDYWHKGVATKEWLFDSRDIYNLAFKILLRAPEKKPVRNLAVSCFNLGKEDRLQMDLFRDLGEQEKLVKAVDRVNDHWGNFVITPARMIGMNELILDRVAFGGVKELEEIVLN